LEDGEISGHLEFRVDGSEVGMFKDRRFAHDFLGNRFETLFNVSEEFLGFGGALSCFAESLD